MKKTTVLCILDGVGKNPDSTGNAVAQAHTPNLDRFYGVYPHSRLTTHGNAVGLPDGQMGNSEVGHTNLGAGRVVPQMLERLRSEMADGTFARKKTVQALVKQAQHSPAIHLIGLVSDGGIHSHGDHLLGVVETLVATNTSIYIHAITDGRDTAPEAAQAQLAALDAHIKKYPNVQIVDVCGRFYAMDRDNRSERTQAATDLYMQQKSPHQAENAAAAAAAAYARGETDEFIAPTCLPATTSRESCAVGKDDTVVFFNFRADRMRRLVAAFIAKTYKNIFTMTTYDSAFAENVSVLYPPEAIKNTLGEVVATAGKSQFRIAETEKYPHVTFFFNGGAETAFANEDRKIIPSPKVRTYDLQPEMSLGEVTDALLAAIKGGQYDMIVCNIANGDMVGHSGDLNAAIKAMEAVDEFLGGLEVATKDNGGHVLLTSDHGNCERMTDEHGAPVTSHSTFPVPLFYVGSKKGIKLKNGVLSDIAPTLLHLMALDVPHEMTGQNLIEGST